jgi:hypothetical protein
MIYPELNEKSYDLRLVGEVWREAVGWEGLYSVSNLGRVRREDWGIPRFNSIKLLKAHPAGGRYPKVVLCGKHKGKVKATRSVHRMVAEAFVENPSNKPQIHHVNANVMDARASNLEWTTQKENIAYAFKEGRKRVKKGESCNLNKYSEALVRDVYLGILLDAASNGHISEQFKVAQGYISSLKTKRIWKELTDEIDREYFDEKLNTKRNTGDKE